jgi:hypothetical protein
MKGKFKIFVHDLGLDVFFNIIDLDLLATVLLWA